MRDGKSDIGGWCDKVTWLQKHATAYDQSRFLNEIVAKDFSMLTIASLSITWRESEYA
jgi:hypothetical protein